MVNFRQVALAFLASYFNTAPTQEPVTNVAQSKSIAIVGAGGAGLAALKTLLDLSQDKQLHWDVVVFERRHNVGGVW